jgi:archaetidylinositol phosphate synthase
MACLGFAWGSRNAVIWGGVLWTISALLDRADGELARLAGLSSATGHLYDVTADIGVNAALFASAGIGLRHGPLGPWAILPGLLCSACLALCLYWSEEIESKLEPGAIVLGGAGGFDPDDLFYLIGPLAWLGALPFVLVSGAIVLVPAAIGIGIWASRARKRARPAERDAAQTRNV